MSRKSSGSRRSNAGQSRMSPQQVLISLVVLLVLATAAFLLEQPQAPESPASNDAPPPASGPSRPVPANDALRAYFTTPTLVYPDRRDQRGDSPLMDAVIADLNAAKRTIDLATFDLDLEPIGQALIAARRRGVEVRLVVDSEHLEDAKVAALTGALEQARIPVTFDDREAFMHNKFLVVDSSITWFGSWNLTENDTFRNNNNMVRAVNAQLAGYYQAEFEQMFGGAFGSRKQEGIAEQPVRIGNARLTAYFSPKDRPAQYVVEAINQARSSIRFMTFSFTSEPIGTAMIEQHKAGVSVQGVFERQNAEGVGAEYPIMRDAGMDVFEDGNCYIVHHKVIILDERIVITGSFNFTANADRSNDENMVIIDDPALAQAYLEEYQRIYEQAKNPLRCGA